MDEVVRITANKQPGCGERGCIEGKGNRRVAGTAGGLIGETVLERIPEKSGSALPNKTIGWFFACKLVY